MKFSSLPSMAILQLLDTRSAIFRKKVDGKREDGMVLSGVMNEGLLTVYLRPN